MSYGSGTETRYGTSEPPDHASATDAVWPPEVEEEVRRRDLALVEQHLAGRRVDRGRGRRLLGRDAAVDLAARVGMRSYAPVLRTASAYERATTACAFNASTGQPNGTSRGTTPYR